LWERRLPLEEAGDALHVISLLGEVAGADAEEGDNAVRGDRCLGDAVLAPPPDSSEI
jgi:hypothetical protein